MIIIYFLSLVWTYDKYIFRCITLIETLRVNMPKDANSKAWFLAHGFHNSTFALDKVQEFSQYLLHLHTPIHIKITSFRRILKLSAPANRPQAQPILYHDRGTADSDHET